MTWQLILTLMLLGHPDGMYYELTWDYKNKQAYLDAYKKFENMSIHVD